MPTSKFRPRTPVVPCLLLILGFAVEMTDGPVARAADEHPAATTGTPAHLSPPVAVVTATAQSPAQGEPATWQCRFPCA